MSFLLRITFHESWIIFNHPKTSPVILASFLLFSEAKGNMIILCLGCDTNGNDLVLQFYSFFFQSKNELMLPEDFAVKDISAFKAIPFVFAVISLVCLAPLVFGYFMKNICWFDLHQFLGDLKRDPKSEKRWEKRSHSVYRDMKYIKLEKKIKIGCRTKNIGL